MTMLASSLSTTGVPRAWRGSRIVAEVFSQKCKCGTIRHTLAPYISDLGTPRDHEVRCYNCNALLGIWLTSGVPR